MTTMAFGPEVKRLFSRLRKAGYSSKFLKAALPDWWEPDVEAEPGLVDDLKIALARQLGLNVAALLEAGIVEPQLPTGMRFKRAQRIGAESEQPFVAFCASLARTITASMPAPSSAPKPDAGEVRSRLLASARWLSLNALLRYCWEDLNIPVISVQRAPTDTRGLDAVTFKISGRYVVITAKNAKPHAWLSFIIAHELGHIALGHVGDEEALADHPILGSEANVDNDIEEEAANQYALTLLGGDVQFVVGDRSGMPDVESAIEAGKDTGVDPGHLILRYARGSGNWHGAQVALAALHRASGQPAAPTFIDTIAQNLLSLDAVADDARDNVLRAIGESE